MTDTLHIYGQFAQHSDAHIAGDRTSLLRLRDLIDHVLGKEEYDEVSVEGMNFFTNDGEGYSVYVRSFPEEIMDKLSVPYTWEHAQDNRDFFPWNVSL